MTTHVLSLFDTTRASVLEVKAPRAARLLARLVGIGLMIVVLLLIFVPWQQNLAGEGRVIAYAPLERQQFIEAPIEGRIQKWHVQEGDRVEKGELIADIADNDPEILVRLERERMAIEARKLAAKSAADVNMTKITALELSRNAQTTSADLRAIVGRDRLDAAEQAVTAAKAATATAKLNVERHKVLYEEGLASKRQLELATMEANTTAATLESANANLKATRREMGALFSDATAIDENATATIEEARSALATAQSEMASADADLAQLDIRLARQRRMSVFAPRTGTVLRLIGREGGEIVQMGDAIAGFVPDMESVAVELWVGGRDGPLISPGRKVRLQFEGWPAVQFMGWPSAAVGTFGGIVEFVDATADARGRFRVVVSPDPDDHPWPASRWLRQGVRANGWVLLERVRLGFELWRQINGFPPALATDPETGAPLTSAPQGGITPPPEGT
jgi:membrane fusion protein, adhesin transport system